MDIWITSYIAIDSLWIAYGQQADHNLPTTYQQLYEQGRYPHTHTHGARWYPIIYSCFIKKSVILPPQDIVFNKKKFLPYLVKAHKINLSKKRDKPFDLSLIIFVVCFGVTSTERLYRFKPTNSVQMHSFDEDIITNEWKVVNCIINHRVYR